MDSVELPQGLRAKIVSSLRHEELRRARIYIGVSCITVIISLFGLIYAFTYTVQGFYQSSFYFSLLLSDPDIIFSYWKELSLSLVETVPFVGVTLSLIALGVLLASVRIGVRSARPHIVPLWR